MYLTRFKNSVIMPYHYDLELAKKEVQQFIAFFGDEYKVTEAVVLPKGFDSDLLNKTCISVEFSPALRFANRFEFSAFANQFDTHKDTDVAFAKEYCLNFLNSKYPHLAPFSIDRIETKDGKEGITGTNQYLESNSMMITYTPLINTNWA